MMKWYQLLILLFCSLCGPVPLRAEFVLDDFDDAAETIAPAMLNEFIETSDIGTSGTVRNIRIAASSLNSIAMLDADVTAQSALSMNLSNPGTTGDGRSPLFAFQFNYDFAPADISEGGLNNAILFDFQFIEGNESPLFLRVIVQDDTNNTNSYQNHVFNLPLSSGPFTAVMPFDTFTIRGGSPGLPDFTTIDRMDFDFFFLRPSLDTQWSAELGRIRFGRIPEPGSAGLGLAGLLCLLRRQLLFVGLPFDSQQHASSRSIHSTTEAHQHVDGRRFLIQFQQTNVVSGNISGKSQILLGQSRFQSRFANFVAQHGRSVPIDTGSVFQL